MGVRVVGQKLARVRANGCGWGRKRCCRPRWPRRGRRKGAGGGWRRPPKKKATWAPRAAGRARRVRHGACEPASAAKIFPSSRGRLSRVARSHASRCSHGASVRWGPGKSRVMTPASLCTPQAELLRRGGARMRQGPDLGGSATGNVWEGCVSASDFTLPSA